MKRRKQKKEEEERKKREEAEKAREEQKLRDVGVDQNLVALLQQQREQRQLKRQQQGVSTPTKSSPYRAQVGFFFFPLITRFNLQPHVASV